MMSHIINPSAMKKQARIKLLSYLITSQHELLRGINCVTVEASQDSLSAQSLLIKTDEVIIQRNVFLFVLLALHPCMAQLRIAEDFSIQPIKKYSDTYRILLTFN